MPPYKVKVSCLECRFSRTGYSIITLDKGDKHAGKTDHTLQIWRISQPPVYLGLINPSVVHEPI